MQFTVYTVLITSLAAAVSAMPAPEGVNSRHARTVNLGTPTERDVPSRVEERSEKVTEWKAKGTDKDECSTTWGGHCQATCVAQGIAKKCHSGTVASEIVGGCGLKIGQKKCLCDCTVTV